MRANDVIVINDDGEEAQVEIPTPEIPPLTIKVEHEDIPQDSEAGTPELRRSTRNRVQMQLFSPRTKGKYHKGCGLRGVGGEFQEC